MKKLTSLLAAAFLAVTLTACGGENNGSGEAELEDTEAFFETDREDETGDEAEQTDDTEDVTEDEEDEESGETLENDEYIYIKYADHIKIKRYLLEEEEVTVPSEIDGVKVTVIGDQSFTCIENTKKITVPDSVTQIETAAFWGCDSLSEFIFPETVEKIEQMTFQACDNLTEITIPMLLDAQNAKKYKNLKSGYK